MQQRLREARENEDGFTLIELLIVIVVLGILATIVVFGVAQFRDDANTAACEADLKTIELAADAYNAKVGSYPTSIDQVLDQGYLKADDAADLQATGLVFHADTQTVTAGNCSLG